jgi:hypothetical protein
VQRVAQKKREKALELAAEEARLQASLVEKRSLEHEQRAHAVKSLFARRLLRQEEKHAELRTSVSLVTLSSSGSSSASTHHQSQGSASADKEATRQMLQKQQQDAAAVQAEKRATIAAQRQAREQQLLAKAQELRRRRDEAAARNVARKQAVLDATAAAAAQSAARRGELAAEIAHRLVVTHGKQDEEHARLRAELTTASGERRRLAARAVDTESRRRADLALALRNKAAVKHLHAREREEAAARMHERQAQAQLARAAAEYEAKRQAAERLDLAFTKQQDEAHQRLLEEQQRKRNLVLLVRTRAVHVREQRHSAAVCH